MVRTMLSGCVAAATVAGGASMADAAIYDFNGKQVDVEYWAGAGSNEALLALDFGPGDGGVHDSFVFGYRWNEGDLFERPEEADGVVEPTISAATSEAMLLAVADAGGLDVGFTYFGGLGLSVDSFAYAGHSFNSDWISNFASFWHSGNVEYTDWNGDTYPAADPDGTTWIEAGLGVSSRELIGGFYDGWSRGVVTEEGEFLAEPPVIHFVPEPASLAVLLVGGAALLRRHV